jgi:hypothetical protein
MNAIVRVPTSGDSRAAGVKRLSAKLFVRDGIAVDQSHFIPVFHRWIRQGALDQLLIDVADYRHVHHGPGVMLIAHEGHYAMDEEAGQAGLLFQQTRWEGSDPQDRLRSLLCATLAACRRLEHDLSDRIRFRTDEILVRVADRLAAPDTAETFAQWRRIASALLEPVFDTRVLRIRHEPGEAALTMRLLLGGELGIDQIIDRLCLPDPLA